jgi:hypothetical protein
MYATEAAAKQAYVKQAIAAASDFLGGVFAWLAPGGPETASRVDIRVDLPKPPTWLAPFCKSDPEDTDEEDDEETRALNADIARMASGKPRRLAS